MFFVVTPPTLSTTPRLDQHPEAAHSLGGVGQGQGQPVSLGGSTVDIQAIKDIKDIKG